jgi:predicted nucleic acid-binding protein
MRYGPRQPFDRESNKLVPTRLGAGIIADALIAATALIHNLRLATRNLQHFTPIEGLQVEKPYD